MASLDAMKRGPQCQSRNTAAGHMKRPRKTPTLLLIEDDETDVFLVRRSLAKHGGDINLKVARDGTEALEMLAPDGEVQKPFVILTDLNMPGMSGYEFLDVIRSDGRLSDSLVFVISSSDLPEDVDRAYASAASGYIVKDLQPEKMMKAVNLVFDFCETFQLAQ